METAKGLLVAIAIKPQKRQQIIIREPQGSILDEQLKQAKLYKRVNEVCEKYEGTELDNFFDKSQHPFML